MKAPGYLDVSKYDGGDSLEDLAMDLYQQSADAVRRLRRTARECEEKLQEQSRELDRVIDALGGVRFAFGAVLQRLTNGRDDVDPADCKRLLELFARQWDSVLQRCDVEIRDLSGQVVTDELAGALEVRDAIPDPGVTQLTVRETLSPAVMYRGRQVGRAVVITSAPVSGTDGNG